MKQLTSLLFAFLAVHAYGCSCVGNAEVEESYQSNTLVVVAQVIEVDTVRIWSDTSYAFRRFQRLQELNEIDSSMSYQKYLDKYNTYCIKLLDYTVVVKESFKGAKSGDTLKIRTGFEHGDCGFRFQQDGEFLIYAEHEKDIKYNRTYLGRSTKELRGIFRTNSCKRTAKREDASEDLEYLRKQ